MMGLPPARSQLARYSLRHPRPVARGLIHPRHSVQTRAAVANLASSASTDAVTVAFVGDSTTLLSGNDSLSEFETMSGQIMRRLKEDNPGTTFRFLNRGVGGSTWFHLATFPTGASILWPSWYTAQTQPWVETYIAKTGNGGANKACDLLIIQMGTNDNSAATFANIRLVLDKLMNATNFPITPDVWLCTSFGRTRNLARSTAAQVAGSLLATNVNRAVARAGAAAIGSTYTKPLGLLDFGRMDAMARWGGDYASQALGQSDVSALQGLTTAATATGFTLPSTDGDFEYQVTFPLQSATLWSGRSLRLGAGPVMNDGANVPLFLITRSGTTVATAYQPGSGSTSFNGTGVTVADGVDVVLLLTCKGSQARLQINGTTVFDQTVARPSAPYSPRIWWSVDGAAVTMNVNRFRPGRALAYAPTMSEADAWGTNLVGLNGTTGGNMINHPSSLYQSEVVRAVLDHESFYLGPA